MARTKKTDNESENLYIVDANNGEIRGKYRPKEKMKLKDFYIVFHKELYRVDLNVLSRGIDG